MSCVRSQVVLARPSSNVRQVLEVRLKVRQSNVRTWGVREVCKWEICVAQVGYEWGSLTHGAIEVLDGDIGGRRLGVRTLF